MATFGTLKTNISLRLKDENNTVVSDANVGVAVNKAIDYWKKHPFFFNEFVETVTISSGASSFSLSTNTPLYLFEQGGVVIEQNDTRYPLKKVSTIEYDMMNSEGTGQPFVWTYRNDGFEVYYYADQAYTAYARGIKDYSAFATDGTDNSSSNDFTTEVQDLIEYEALARLWMEILQDEAMSNYFMKMAEREYQNYLKFHRGKNATGRIEIHSALI